jgi:hypothetical protein
MSASPRRSTTRVCVHNTLSYYCVPFFFSSLKFAMFDSSPRSFLILSCYFVAHVSSLPSCCSPKHDEHFSRCNTSIVPDSVLQSRTRRLPSLVHRSDTQREMPTQNKRHDQLFNFLFVSWLCIPAQLELCLGTIHLCCCFILRGHSCAIQLFRLIAPFLPMLQSAAPEYLDGQSSKRRSFGERLCYGAGVSYLVGASDNTFFDTLYACSGPLFWFW